MLGIYIHIPFCKSRCNYCSFVSSTDPSIQESYIGRLIDEIKKRKTTAEVDTVYFGGGTPSMLKLGELTRIMNSLKGNFNIIKGAEITIEANPDSLNESFANECKDLGINRVSLGLQTTNDGILKIINRPHTYTQFLSAVNNLFNVGITNISCDLMLGLPSQTKSHLIESIDKVCALPIKHISLYGLSVEKATPLYESGYSVDEEASADMYEEALSRLKSYGFIRYEISNFCLNGFHSRHNCKYWDLSPYIGVGVAAHSYINGERLENTDSLREYLSGKTIKNITPIDLCESRNEYIMLSLRTSEGMDISRLKNEFRYNIMEEKSKEIAFLQDKNLIILDKNRLKLDDNAFYVSSSVILKLL